MDIDCLCLGIMFADVACSPIARMPASGELVVSRRIELGIGGCACNTAMNLAKLGVCVGIAGCVGRDGFGRFILDKLTGGGIDTAGIRQLDGPSTASTMIVEVEGQSKRFITSPGANTSLGPEHIPRGWLSSAKVVYIGGYLMFPSLETREMVDLLATARSRGTKVILDVVGAANRGFFDRLALMLPVTDVFLPNEAEAAALTGLSNPSDQAQRFRDAGVGTVVITRGERGSLLFDDRMRLRADAYPTQYAGATGAGDAFDAGYIAGILAGEDPAGCLRWGSALGASCVRSSSATDSVFQRDEAEAFMRQNSFRIDTF